MDPSSAIHARPHEPARALAADEAQAELPTLAFEWPDGAGMEALSREWLVTNGLGGYACGTLAQCPSRRYHALFNPSVGGHGRVALLGRVAEAVQVDAGWHRLDGEERTDGTQSLDGAFHLRAFRLRGLLPEWDYRVGPVTLRRRFMMVHEENTAFLAYENLGAVELHLRLRPFPAFRSHDGPLVTHPGVPVVRIGGENVELQAHEGAPPLRMRVYAQRPFPFVALRENSPSLIYRTEASRGYEHAEVQCSPGYFDCTLAQGETIFLGFTSDAWELLDRDPAEAFQLEQERQQRLLQHAAPGARRGTGARLVLAADQFIIRPANRPADEAWARAGGMNARSVIAGYHWFTDWGRDTMISLEGLTLSTGRAPEAAAILRTFQHYVREGLLPNYFPDGENEGLYHTADATLWFFHAIDRYLDHTGDDELLRDLFPTLESIVEHHLRGTRFHIGVDPDDGLLSQGEDGYQLTWMDAKVESWVVTPRRGKAVEINALWFNALQLMADWAQRLGRDPARYVVLATRTRHSFNGKFWNEAKRCLFDVVGTEQGGNDDALRPNQIVSLSLHHPVLLEERWESVLEAVRKSLLTPVGLRSLAPGHRDYRETYDGDLRARDAAYHQGTVWAWLIGHYVDASLRVRRSRPQAHELLLGLETHLRDACVGQISEIFDATEPYRPRGCVAQAWSVAEMLRAWIKTG